MSIDLNTCVGCNACVVACQAENNIPIVGKDQALRGREMHWIRIDRYYSDGHADAAAFGGGGNRGIPEDPQNFPAATCLPAVRTRSLRDGLPGQCHRARRGGNQCHGLQSMHRHPVLRQQLPVQGPRFNYFDFNLRQLDSLYMGPLGPHGMPELVKMVKNPEVSVRMRGVMEKCTYCIQRIENGKIQWKVKSTQEGRPATRSCPMA